MEVTPKSRNIGMSDKDTLSFMIAFTGTYQEYKDAHPAIREAMCLKVQYPAILCRILDGDQFAGRVEWPPLSFTPQADGNEGGFGYVFNYEKFNTLIQSPDLSNEDKDTLNEIRSFWNSEHTSFKTRQAYPEALQKGLPSDNWTREPGIAFPLYRMAGTHLDFKKLLTYGINGLIRLLEGKKVESLSGSSQEQFYRASIIALEIFQDACHYYEKQAWEMSLTVKDHSQKHELEEMAVALRNIAGNKPATLREAIQLSFLYTVVSGTQNYGRIDDYLGDFLAADLEKGILTHDSALRLFEGYWKILISRNAAYDGRAIVGGKGRSNEKNANALALLAIETAGRVIDILPQLTLRFSKDQNTALYVKALETLGKGSTFPMLYNDDANIPAVQKAFDVPYEDAVDYLPFGCGEYILNHKSVGTPSSVLNLLKCLEVTLHKGTDPVSQTKMGVDLSQADFSTFEGLWKAYSENLEYYTDLLAIQEEIEYRVAGEQTACLYFSILYDDCIARGKSIFNGGVRYLGGTMETYGNTSTADSLTAIKKTVYDTRAISFSELITALDSNFKGYESLRKRLLDAPKYGNDIAEADEMAAKVHEHVCRYTRSQRSKTGLHNFLVVNINNDANTTLGKYTSASADGRLAFTSMSNANSPMMGMDRNGITAMLNSMLKMDIRIHAGAVQNMKFSKDMLTKYRDKLEALLKTYFDKGGAQAMLTVVGKNDLQQAIREPEKYHHIVVRVGGFSARFVELSKEVQTEILNRTLY